MTEVKENVNATKDPMTRYIDSRKYQTKIATHLGNTVKQAMTGKSNAFFGKECAKGCILVTRVSKISRAIQPADNAAGTSIQMPKLETNRIILTKTHLCDTLDMHTIETIFGEVQEEKMHGVLNVLLQSIWPTLPTSLTNVKNSKVESENVASVFHVKATKQGVTDVDREILFASNEVFYAEVESSRSSVIRIARDAKQHLALFQHCILDDQKKIDINSDMTEVLFVFNAYSRLSAEIIPKECLADPNTTILYGLNNGEMEGLKSRAQDGLYVNIRDMFPHTRYIDLKRDSYARFSPDEAVKHAHRLLHDMALLDSTQSFLAAIAATMCRVIGNPVPRDAKKVYQERRTIIKAAESLAGKINTSDHWAKEMDRLMISTSIIADYIGILLTKIQTKEASEDSPDAEQISKDTTKDLDYIGGGPESDHPDISKYGQILARRFMYGVDVIVSPETDNTKPRAMLFTRTPWKTNRSVVSEIRNVESGVLCKSETGAEWKMRVLYQIKNPFYFSLTNLIHSSASKGMWWKYSNNGNNAYSYYTEFPSCEKNKSTNPKEFDHSISVNIDVTRLVEITISAPFPSLKGRAVNHTRNSLPA
jgi:hypothetical protein